MKRFIAERILPHVVKSKLPTILDPAKQTQSLVRGPLLICTLGLFCICFKS